MLIDKKYNCGPGNFRVSRKKGKWIEFATAVLDMDFDRMYAKYEMPKASDRNAWTKGKIDKAKDEYLKRLEINGK